MTKHQHPDKENKQSDLNVIRDNCLSEHDANHPDKKVIHHQHGFLGMVHGLFSHHHKEDVALHLPHRNLGMPHLPRA